MTEAEDDKRFYFAGGQSAKSIAELRDALRSITPEEFVFHVNSAKNDFANWIEGVFGQRELADELRHVMEKDDSVAVLDRFVARSGEQSTHASPAKDADVHDGQDQGQPAEPSQPAASAPAPPPPAAPAAPAPEPEPASVPPPQPVTAAVSAPEPVPTPPPALPEPATPAESAQVPEPAPIAPTSDVREEKPVQAELPADVKQETAPVEQHAEPKPQEVKPEEPLVPPKPHDMEAPVFRKEEPAVDPREVGLAQKPVPDASGTEQTAESPDGEQIPVSPDKESEHDLSPEDLDQIAEETRFALEMEARQLEANRKIRAHFEHPTKFVIKEFIYGFILGLIFGLIMLGALMNVNSCF